MVNYDVERLKDVAIQAPLHKYGDWQVKINNELILNFKLSDLEFFYEEIGNALAYVKKEAV